MTTGAHFESMEDVNRYFEFRRGLGPTPVPPVDLLERLDQQRNSQRQHSVSSQVLIPAVPYSLEINTYPRSRSRKSYELKQVKRVRTIVMARVGIRKARHSLTAPMSWKDLL